VRRAEPDAGLGRCWRWCKKRSNLAAFPGSAADTERAAQGRAAAAGSSPFTSRATCSNPRSVRSGATCRQGCSFAAAPAIAASSASSWGPARIRSGSGQLAALDALPQLAAVPEGSGRTQEGEWSRHGRRRPVEIGNTWAINSAREGAEIIIAETGLNNIISNGCAQGLCDSRLFVSVVIICNQYSLKWCKRVKSALVKYKIAIPGRTCGKGGSIDRVIS
jgi:hypothetical protein